MQNLKVKPHPVNLNYFCVVSDDELISFKTGNKKDSTEFELDIANSIKEGLELGDIIYTTIFDLSGESYSELIKTNA